MNLIINGQEKRVEQSQNVYALLKSLRINPDITAVEKNGEIIDKRNYKNEGVSNGDKFELIRFMGGG